jgi:hypothetical protein
VSAAWAGANVQLELWRPGTTQIDRPATVRTYRVAASVVSGAQQRLAFVAPAAGSYYVEVKASSPGFGAYALQLTKQ